nr:TrkH family potassium uptake protein [Maliibacterium massiliense]
MNYKAVLHILGRILLIEAVLLLLPVLVGLLYGESVIYFLCTICVLLAAAALCVLPRHEGGQIYAREGFVIVALSWVCMSLAGALPFYLSGYIPSFVDAFFETVSGFTTTGASILTDVEALPHGLLFWRSFTHWIGGMGVLVFVMAIMPMAKVRSVHIMRAEVPGPTKSKLVPRMKSTAMILYGIYILLTVMEIIFLLCGGMPLFDALVHAFGTAGTGGFGIKNLSIGYYDSAYIEVVVGAFMILFGINFNLYYLLLLGNIRSILKNEELRWYLGIILAAIIVITINVLQLFGDWGTSLRHAFFQVSSIVTTTGFSTTDFQLWPSLSRSILVVLMLIGACAGSTAGGIKVSRLVIAFKSARREIKHLLHPHAVDVVKVNGATVDENVVRATGVFICSYLGIILISTLITCVNGYDLETSTTAVISCISNIGPGLGLVGPMSNFSLFSPLVKLLLSLNMLLGRLELYPMLLLFAPSTWRKRA